jgi:hypothetical protein
MKTQEELQKQLQALRYAIAQITLAWYNTEAQQLAEAEVDQKRKEMLANVDVLLAMKKEVLKKLRIFAIR